MRVVAVWIVAAVGCGVIDPVTAGNRKQKDFKNKAEVVSAYDNFMYFNPNILAFDDVNAASFTPGVSESNMTTIEPMEYSKESVGYARLLKNSLGNDYSVNRGKKNGKGNGKGNGKSRERRQINASGTVTTIRSCVPRGTVVEGTIQLVTVCAATTTLPADRFPRYLNEFLCYGFDLYCLSYEGYATQQFTYIKLRRNPGNFTTDQLQNWIEYDQQLRTGCTCKLYQGSVFVPFV